MPDNQSSLDTDPRYAFQLLLQIDVPLQLIYDDAIYDGYIQSFLLFVVAQYEGHSIASFLYRWIRIGFISSVNILIIIIIHNRTPTLKV